MPIFSSAMVRLGNGEILDRSTVSVIERKNSCATMAPRIARILSSALGRATIFSNAHVCGSQADELGDLHGRHQFTRYPLLVSFRQSKTIAF